MNGTLQCGHQVVTINGLLDEVVSSTSQRLHREIVLAMTGNEESRRIWPQFLYLCQQCQTVHTGHLDIAHDGGVLVLSDLLNSCLGRVACIHFDSVQAQV